MAASFLTAFAVTSCTEKFDSSLIEKEIEDIKNRLSLLEETVNGLNADVRQIRSVVDAMEKNISVVDVTETTDGYSIVFSDGKTIYIRANVRDGVDGKDGETPVIGVKEYDGVLYWTVNGDFLLDANGAKVPVTGADAKAPVIGVKEFEGVLYWTVNGEFLLDENGDKVVAGGQKGDSGESFFDDVIVDDDTVTFVLSDGSRLSLARLVPASLSLESTSLTFANAETRNVEVQLANIKGITVTEKPEGWKAYILEDTKAGYETKTLVITAPKADNADADAKGYVAVLATSGTQTFIGKVKVALSEGQEPENPGDDNPGDDNPGGEHQNPTTYTLNFSANDINSYGASISVRLQEGLPFYAGLYCVKPGVGDAAIAEIFYRDASPVIAGFTKPESDEVSYGNGEWGVRVEASGYSGTLSMLTPHDDGSGKMEGVMLIPGARYAIGILPIAAGADYSKLSASDVILEFVQLKELTAASSNLVSVYAGANTTNSASASFDITSAVNRFHYTLVQKSEFEASGMTEMEFALYGKGVAIWDRTAINAKGSISGIDAICTRLAPGEECYAIGLAISSTGSYQLVKLSVFSKTVETTAGTFAVNSHSVEKINDNSYRVKVNYTASGVEKIRYTAKNEYGTFGSDDDAYMTLASGGMWEYDSINAGEDMVFYVYPGVAWTLYAVGMDADQKFTSLVKYEFELN